MSNFTREQVETVMSGGIRSALWSELPAAVLSPGIVFRVTDLGNLLVESDGARWRPMSGVACLRNLASLVNIQGTTEQNAFAVKIPAGLLKDGDDLRFRATIGKSGTVESATASVRFGPARSLGDTVLNSAVLLGAATQSFGLLYDLKRTSALGLRKIGNGSFGTGYAGGSSPAVNAVTALASSMDTVDQYFQINFNSSAGAETITLFDAALEWVTGVTS